MTTSRLATLLLLATFVLPGPAGAAIRLPRLGAGAPAVPGEVLVALPAGESFGLDGAGAVHVPDARRAALLAAEGLAPVRVIGRGGSGVRGRPGALGDRFALLRGVHVAVDAEAAAARLRASGLFAAAIPNVSMRLLETLPDDARLAEQWWVKDATNADVQLPEAWDVTHGSAAVVIAILDTGVDTGHPDLASRIWTNPAETPGNGVDDDANGYVDDLNGWDFGDGDADPNPVPLIDELGLDEGFHGTMCAGIAAAATDNGEGIAGAGWSCRILPLKIFDSNFGSTAEMFTAAIEYALDQDADVISMSLGAVGGEGIPEFFQALMDQASAAGAVCVAAAGNDGVDELSYPAACNHVIAVGATDENNARAEFSNYGAWVDVAAPGTFMISTLCRNYEIDELSQIFYLYFFYWDGETPYMYGDGTSFACPLVAGVCGLVRAVQPGIGSDAMEARLKATGDVVAYDQPIGRRVNAWGAVTGGATAVGPSRPVAGLSLGAPVPNPASGAVRLAWVTPAPGEAELAIFDAAGRRVRVLATGFVPAGAREASWDGRDELGREAAAGLYFARLTQAGARRVARLVRLPR